MQGANRQALLVSTQMHLGSPRILDLMGKKVTLYIILCPKIRRSGSPSNTRKKSKPRSYINAISGEIIAQQLLSG